MDIQATGFFTPDDGGWLQSVVNAVIDLWPSVIVFVKHFIGILIGVSIPVCVFLIIVLIYCIERLKALRKKQSEIYDKNPVEAGFETVDSGDRELAHRWEHAMKHIDSQNPNDWKQAIIDADIILDDLLTRLGYQGESIGEKLKRVAKGDMQTLNDAWEAHKIRNQIAHEPSFVLDHHVARHAIAMYKRVFEEFYYI